jgi:hypothetical protein
VYKIFIFLTTERLKDDDDDDDDDDDGNFFPKGFGVVNEFLIWQVGHGVILQGFLMKA